MNADGYVSTGQGLNSFNMFAYCGNNPIVNIDVTGTMHVKGTDACGANVVSKMSNNNEISEVFAAEHYTYYKDALVIRHSSDFLTSWSYGGIIFLNHNLDSSSIEYQTQYLNHEYGHILQEKRLGTVKYTFSVAIPSAIYNLFSRSNQVLAENYYNMPWEYEADLRGKVNREHSEWSFWAYIFYFTAWGGLF